MHSTSTAGSSSAISERRGAPPPILIDTVLAQQYGTSQQHVAPVTMRDPDIRGNEHQPPSPSPTRSATFERSMFDEASSVYSQDGDEESAHDTQISPLHIRKMADISHLAGAQQAQNPLRDYTAWAKANESPRTATMDRRPFPIASRDAFRDAHYEEVRRYADPGTATGVFSPLTPFFQSKETQAVRKGTKVMIGDNGWLERTGVSPVKPSPSKRSLLDPLRKMAKEVAEMADFKASRRIKDIGAERRESGLAISLDPREQSLLYGELEYIVTSALENYITCQFQAGRLDAGKYKKIVDSWQQKGRPKVVGFRYDLETQLHLVHLHHDQFKFYGHQAGVAAAITGMLEMMKVNARAIRIRTFCQPDTVIAKQLIDSQQLFNLVGCSEAEQIQLAEIVQFFKIVLKREKHFRGEARLSESSSTGKPLARGHSKPQMGGVQRSCMTSARERAGDRLPSDYHQPNEPDMF